MSAKGIRAGRAYVELGTDDSRFTAGLKSAQAKLRSWGMGLAKIGGVISAAGAAITGPLMGAVWAASNAGDELTKMADRTGASVEALSELQHAASQSDVEFDALGKSMHKMQRNLVEADQGNKAAAESFSRLGVSVDELRQLTPDQQFEVLADRIAAIEDPAGRTAAAMEVFGKSGADLMPLMLNGAAGIKALRQEARDLGLQVSTKDASAATLFGDTWANLQSVLMDVTKELGFALLPALTDVIQSVIPYVVEVGNWISQNRELIVTVAAVGAGLTAAGTVIVSVGGAAIAASMAIGGLVSIGTALAGVFGAILSPLGLVVAGIAGATVAFLHLTTTGQAIVNWFGTNFGTLLQVVQNTVGGIFNAIQNGRLDVAAQIAFTGIKLAVATVMESVLGIFGLSIDDMMAMLAGLWKRINEVMARLNVARQEAVNWLSSQLANLGFGTGDDERGRKLEADRLRIMAEKDIETTANDTSMGANLEGIQQQDMQTALDGLAAVEAMDPEAMGKEWAAAWNVDALKAELEQLNAAANEPQPVDVTALSVPGLDAIQSAAVLGTDEAALANATDGPKARGTFSALEASLFGGGDTVQKDQLAALKSIDRRLANATPATATG